MMMIVDRSGSEKHFATVAEELEELGEDERRVYEYVKSNGEVFSDEICSKLEMDPFLVNSITSILEIKGFVSFSMGRIMAVKF